jgi:hypothetical protein
MKYSPRLIIFCAVSRYLNDATYAKVLDQIGEEFPKQDRKFLAILKRHFDFELMKDKPYIWQDIWIYNFLKYERVWIHNIIPFNNEHLTVAGLNVGFVFGDRKN